MLSSETTELIINRLINESFDSYHFPKDLVKMIQEFGTTQVKFDIFHEANVKFEKLTKSTIIKQNKTIHTQYKDRMILKHYFSYQ